MSFISVDKNKCVACGECVKVCPAMILAMDTENRIPVSVTELEESCIDCGHCVAACAPGAIERGKIKVEDSPKINSDILPSSEAIAEFLKSRRSVRMFKDKPVAKELIEQTIDVTRWAPTGKNAQPIKWAVVHDTQRVKKLSSLVIDWMAFMLQKEDPMAKAFNFAVMIEAYKTGIDGVLRTAPHLVVAYSHKDNVFGPSSAPLCISYLELAAYSKGLATCWAGFFDIALKYWPPLQQALNLPEDHVGLGSVMLGYSDENYNRIPKRNEADIQYI